MGGLKLITAPTSEPLSVTFTKKHLRVEGTDDDDYIRSLIVAARINREAFTGRQFITATWEWNLDSFRSAVLEVPNPPLIKVNSIKYIDTDGILQTWAASKYDVDTVSQPGRITPAFGEDYPSTRDVMNAVVINFDAGYGAADTVPLNLKQSMQEIVGHMYEHRETVIVGASISQVPQSADWLAWQDRRFIEV